MAALLVAVSACSLAAVRATNFAGFDEWLFLWLARRGVLDSPYSNRPLNFLWTIPGAWVLPHSFLGFHVMHAVYLTLTALVLRGLVLKLSPGQPRLAAVAGLVAATLAPSDMARLSSIQMTVNSGSIFGVVLALRLLVAAAGRRSPALLAGAIAIGFLTVRSYEATLGVLLAGPLLLSRAEPARRPPLRFVIAWLLGLGVTAALALAPHLAGGDRLYQTAVWGVDFRPASVLPRLLHQYAWHLLPIVQPMPADLLATTSLAAALLAVVATVFAGRATPPTTAVPRKDQARKSTHLALLGLAFSFAAYFPFALSPAMDQPNRAQMAASPWVGLLVAALGEALSSWAPARARGTLVALATGWIVLVGSGRTAMLQRAWDGQSRHAAQQRSMADLVRLAPDLKPHTLVVALPEGPAWPSVFGFRHAVQYLYREHATGYVLGGLELMYPTRWDSEGVHTETWQVVREPWGVPATLHRYDELLLVRIGSDGVLSIVTEWPTASLGPLPSGARYSPESRVILESGSWPERAVLHR